MIKLMKKLGKLVEVQKLIKVVKIKKLIKMKELAKIRKSTIKSRNWPRSQMKNGQNLKV